MTPAQTYPLRLRVAHLNPRAPTAFMLRPDATIRAAIAQELDLPGLPRLTFEGQIRTGEGESWLLEGRLTARASQSCVITLKSVRTDIDEQVRRVYSPHIPVPDTEEAEMVDETLEQLGQFIDISAVMIEALALALPEYPRAEGAELDTPPVPDDPDGTDTRKPFAGLDQLLRRKD